MARNKFLRTCIICREPKEKDDLYRFTIVNGEVTLDYYKKLEGRGFYVCKNKECLEKLNKKVIAKNIKRENFNIDKEKILKTLKNMLKAHIYNTIKICNKSGAIEATFNRLNNCDREICMIILANDCSENTIKKAKKFLKDTFLIKDLFSKNELGKIISKDEVALIGITDKKFCEKLKQLYTEYLGV